MPPAIQSFMQLEFPLQNSDADRFRVEFIPKSIAGPFIERNHYTRYAPTGIFIGGYFDGVLFAVACYSKGTDMVHTNKDGTREGSVVRSISNKSGLPVTRENSLNLQRLCREGTKEDKSPVPLTKFLSRCHRLLKKEYGIRFIVSFSDPDNNGFDDATKARSLAKGIIPQHGSGGIYKAANFQYLGLSSPVYHCVDKNGVIVHRRKAYKYKEKINRERFGPKENFPDKKWPDGAMTIGEARDLFGLTPIKTPPKDIWLLDLGEVKKRPESQ
jgi:hypothetical protein